jgi:subtilase family serine protease
MRASLSFSMAVLLFVALRHDLYAAPAIDIPDAPALVTATIDDAHRVMLDRDMPSAIARDHGALPPDRVLSHVSLVLRRPPGRQQALDRLVRDQLDPRSPLFHRWIDAADLPRFAPSAHDTRAVEAWLGGHGLHVDRLAPSGMAMDVSGPVRGFEAAFGVSLHALAAADGDHIGPLAAPSIPAALQPVIAGVTLGNFFPRPALRRVGAVTQRGDGEWSISQDSPDFTIVDKGAAYHAVTPFDFYYIYHVLPLFNELAGAEGYGQRVALVEQSDMQPEDFKRFYRSFFVVPDTYLSTTHPAGCADPGLASDEVETAVDAEWSSVTAAESKIEIASCAATVNSFGVMTSFQNLIEYGTTATVLSVSYTACETLNGVGFTTMWNDLAEAGAAEGLSIVVASGDSGVAACDSPGDSFGAMYGLAVNALASNPYVTAVGGTDFGDTARHETAEYWAPPSGENVYTKQTALSYVPEIVWDDSCASSFISHYLGLSPQASCNAASSNDPGLLNLAGSGGGASVVFAKPDWQSAALLGVPNDRARDVPDVALFAGDGLWNHFYIYCMSDAAQGGHPCKYPDHGTTAFLSGAGGTSFGAPAFAGLIASIASYKELNFYHKNGPALRLGNVAPRLYQLAATQYAQPLLLASCQANLGNKTDGACIFHEVTSGDNDVFCAHRPNCVDGILSKNASRVVPTYPAHLGYSQATGLGSVDATNLVINY